MKTMKQYASYRQLWQALLPYYDEREAQAVVRMMLEERFGLTLTDIVCGGVAHSSQRATPAGTYRWCPMLRRSHTAWCHRRYAGGMDTWLG